MKKPGSAIALLFAVFGMSVLMLHTDITVQSGSEAISLCLETVIPSILPFMILSMYLSSRLPCRQNTFFIIGLLSGYPVGAQNIVEQFKRQKIDEQAARRLLMFCCNAGPAFIIGMTANMFSNWYIPFILWAIHILSALAVSRMVPKQHFNILSSSEPKHIGFTSAVEKSARALAVVCCWILLFRIATAIILKYTAAYIPCTYSAIFVGLFELANGIIFVQSLPGEGLRFVLCSGLLAFGGICVIMQTSSVIRPLSVIPYVVGKIIQTVISVFLATVMQFLLFPADKMLPAHPEITLPIMIILSIFLYFSLVRKKIVAFG